MAFDWSGNTAPFFADATGDRPARFVLAQVGDGTFRLEEPFTYAPAAGPALTVTDADLGETDLASVPLFLSWFVSRHGRHTPAALVHDQLLRNCGDEDASGRPDADRTFLAALDALGVPPVRSRVMWSAVVLATTWGSRPWGRLRIVAWAASALGGTALLVSGVARKDRVRTGVGAAGPVLAAALWGPGHYRAGLVAGYALWVVAVPAAASFAGYGAYWIAEQLVRLGRRPLPANRDRPLPGPVPYPDT